MLRKHVRILKDMSLGDRQIRIIVSDATPDRVGDVMVPDGCDWSDYRNNPIVLANHNAEHALGTAQVKIRNSRIEALIDFAPKGISHKADEFCGLAKAGVISAGSVGFEPVEFEPLAGGGRRYTKWTLLEISVVSVPANPSATVIGRSATSARNGAVPQTPAERQRAAETDDRDRAERAHRQAIRAEGLAELAGAEFETYLAVEFPGLDRLDGFKAYLARQESMSLHDRFLEKVRKSDFAKAHRRIDAMTPEQHEEYRRREVERLAPPPEPPYRWDPAADHATNSYRQRLSDMCARW